MAELPFASEAERKNVDWQRSAIGSTPLHWQSTPEFSFKKKKTRNRTTGRCVLASANRERLSDKYFKSSYLSLVIGVTQHE